jgi:uncharacterized protein YchJ
MSDLVAFCENNQCGAIFPVPNIFGGNFDVELVGNVYGPCPICGGVGSIPDGSYKVTESVTTFLSGPTESILRLKKVEALLRALRTQSVTKDDVLSQVKAISPAVAASLSTVSPVAVMQQWILIAIALVTLLILMQTTYFPKKSDSDIKQLFMDHLIKENKALNEELSKKKQLKTIKRNTPKISRNASCPCGSEKKYKRCCGA